MKKLRHKVDEDLTQGHIVSELWSQKVALNPSKMTLVSALTTTEINHCLQGKVTFFHCLSFSE